MSMPDDRSRQEIDRAVELGRQQERVRARLDNHEEDIRELRAGHAETKITLGELTRQVGRIEKAIGEAAAAAQAVAAAATETANKAIGNRSFFLGVLAIVAALVGTILAGAHL
jgi:chromosome segregation ATPase